MAAYSLGDTAVLAAATDEIVAWLVAMDLIGPDSDVLDFGCGIGRIAAAVAPRVRSVIGLDLSPGMIAEARRRPGAGNLRFATTEALIFRSSRMRPSTSSSRSTAFPTWFRPGRTACGVTWPISRASCAPAARWRC